MRLHFRETAWDLYIVVGYTLAMSAILVALQVGNPVALLVVLFVPGYVLLATLFPKNTDFDWIERIALSFGLSIAIVPLIGLVPNFMPVGIRFAPVLATLAFFTVGVGYTAYWRRMRLPLERRLALTLDLKMPTLKRFTLVDKVLTTVLAATVVAAAGIFALVVMTPRPGDRFTEFYLLGPDGNASGYPERLNVSQPGTVLLGLTNHEAAVVHYTVRADLLGVQIVENGTSGLNVTREVNRSTIFTLNLTLSQGQDWTRRYTFWINVTGLWKLEFLLYKDAILTAQKLHLFIRVV